MIEFIFSILVTTESVTFEKNAKPIFAKRCQQCHHSGYWEWTKYDNAFKYKDKIRERVWVNRSMPMGGNITEDERRIIRDWVDQGAKR